MKPAIPAAALRRAAIESEGSDRLDDPEDIFK